MQNNMGQSRFLEAPPLRQAEGELKNALIIPHMIPRTCVNQLKLHIACSVPEVLRGDSITTWTG